MIHYYINYYINPKTNELIAFDDERRDVMPLERVGQVLLSALPEIKPIAPARKTLKNSKKPKARKPKPAASKFAGTDEATISKIKEMYEDGSTMKEIKEATGLSYPTIYKYTTMQRKQRKREEDDYDDPEPDEPEDDKMNDEDD
jgi:hypothetical protein